MRECITDRAQVKSQAHCAILTYRGVAASFSAFSTRAPARPSTGSYTEV